MSACVCVLTALWESSCCSPTRMELWYKFCQD